jgi:hypothetical protein
LQCGCNVVNARYVVALLVTLVVLVVLSLVVNRG